jgi:hypothetical protein
MKVFLPYLTWNTVFDNTRVTEELGRKPVPFSDYSYPLLKFSRDYQLHLRLRAMAGESRRVGGMMDLILEAWVSAAIEKSKINWMLGKGKPWQAGEKLRLLFAGYNGTRNMGSDVRVDEMLRQLRHVLGADNVAFTVMSQNFQFSEGYFDQTAQVHLPDIFPPFLSKEVPRHHGVVACEGSMFKSKFANALTTMMIGSLGIAAAENKISIGYGAEAGYHGSGGQEDVRPLLPQLARDYPQRGIARCAARSGGAHRARNRHGLDL